MSFSTVLYPIIAALMAPEGTFLPLNTQWHAINKQQEYFLEQFYTDKVKAQLSLFSQDELKSYVSQDHNELNAIAEQKGFDLKFQKLDAGKFATLSILDISIKWLHEGLKTELEFHGTKYKAALLESANFEIFDVADHHHPIVKIKTKTSDTVFLTKADKPLAGFELTNTYIKLWHSQITHTYYYDSIIFPTVQLNQMVDIAWLQGMRTDDSTSIPYEIGAAVQQTKFKMDETGAHVESAVGITFRPVSLPKIYSIDTPFYIAIVREGSIIPILVAYIDPSDWEKAE